MQSHSPKTLTRCAVQIRHACERPFRIQPAACLAETWRSSHDALLHTD